MRRYCLYCFATLAGLGSQKRSDEHCATCGQTSRVADRRLFWNLSPRIVTVERTIKTLTVLACLACGLLMFLVFPIASGSRAGFYYLLPVFPAIGVWKSASVLTHVQPYFRPRVFWTAVFVLLGLVLGMVHWMLVSIPLVGLIIVLVAARDFRRWKQGLVAQGQGA